MAKDWIMVRILRTTHAELERVRVSMLMGELTGQAKLEKDSRDRFSLDGVITKLIAERDKRKERQRKSRANKKGGEGNGEATATA